MARQAQTGRAPSPPHATNTARKHPGPLLLGAGAGGRCRRAVGHTSGSGTVVLTVVDHDRGGGGGPLQAHRAAAVEDATSGTCGSCVAGDAAGRLDAQRAAADIDTPTMRASIRIGMI